MHAGGYWVFDNGFVADAAGTIGPALPAVAIE
jgi:hypothetical protein